MLIEVTMTWEYWLLILLFILLFMYNNGAVVLKITVALLYCYCTARQNRTVNVLAGLLLIVFIFLKFL